MSIPVSTVPAARTYLINAITTQVNAANLTQPGCEVYDSEPDHQTPNDVVVVGGVRRQVAPMAMVGGGGQFWREERYRVEIVIDCYQAGADASMEAVNVRAYQVLALVETAVRTDPSLGGLVIQAAPEDSDSIPSWDDDHVGARCQITTQVSVYATL